LLKDQFGLAEKVLAASVFPDSGVVKPMPLGSQGRQPIS
jgi:hypothetical protein